MPPARHEWGTRLRTVCVEPMTKKRQVPGGIIRAKLEPLESTLGRIDKFPSPGLV
jgi:hypothetical protein